MRNNRQKAFIHIVQMASIRSEVINMLEQRKDPNRVWPDGFMTVILDEMSVGAIALATACERPAVLTMTTKPCPIKRRHTKSLPSALLMVVH